MLEYLLFFFFEILLPTVTDPQLFIYLHFNFFNTEAAEIFFTRSLLIYF